MERLGYDSPMQPGGIPALGQPGWTDGSWTSTTSGGWGDSPEEAVPDSPTLECFFALPQSYRGRNPIASRCLFQCMGMLSHALLAKRWAEPGQTSRHSPAATYLGHDARGLESPLATAIAEEARPKLMENIHRKRRRSKK